jgi:uncharacterized protein (TIGR00251 family)
MEKSNTQPVRARITVKVHPRARRTQITRRIGDAYKLDVAAPPIDGKANQACVDFFAALGGVPKSRVRIVAGLTSRIKVVEIDGIAHQVMESKLPS